jgi:hypothetical protein
MLMILILLMSPVFAETSDESELFGSSEDELFGSSDSEEDLFGSSEDNLFGGSDDLLTDIENSETDMGSAMLTNEQPVVIGGNYSFSLTPGWGWKFDESDDIGAISANLSSRLYFDARPDESIRVYGKAILSYPFEESENLTTIGRETEVTMVDDEDPANTFTGTVEYEDSFFTSTRSFSDVLSVQELFSDFTVGDDLFIRVGKQNLNWGVGYFFSPANLLNISSIDPLDPEAELTGPVSIKMNKPVGIDNIYGYVVIPSANVALDGLKYAAKYEKVIGNSEVGLGGLYTYGDDPIVMSTLSTSIGDVALFAEGTASFAAIDDVEFAATAGGRYSWSAPESDLSLNLAGQYYYDGSSEYYPHKIAANVSMTLTNEVSIGATWLNTGTEGLPAQISMLLGTDHVGIRLVQPNISWRPVEYVNIQLTGIYTYGDMFEFMGESIMGDALGATVKVTLGNTSF